MECQRHSGNRIAGSFMSVLSQERARCQPHTRNGSPNSRRQKPEDNSMGPQRSKRRFLPTQTDSFGFSFTLVARVQGQRVALLEA